MTARDAQHPPRASLVTLGCPMNEVDSERIMGGLVAQGFEIVHEDEADVIVVNTCGFIESAREESIETILSLAELKKTGPLKALVVAGCLAERYRDALERDLTEADAVIGLGDAARIPDRCRELLGLDPAGPAEWSRVLIGHPHTAYIKIAEGCDNRCAYCAIPSIRGSFRSVPEDEVLASARELADLGIRELILIGQDTTRYGRDTGSGLPQLLERLHGIEAFHWIRLLYAHPARMTDDMIGAFADLSRLVPYLDLPIQHIAAGVLERMGRGTAPDDIRRIIDRVRERVPGVVLRTAVIVGFPGETDRDFRELMEFVETYRIERLGAFIYSPEEGTRAAEYTGRVPDDTARARFDELMACQQEIATVFHQSLVGREFEMIVDDPGARDGHAAGRTYMDAPDIDGVLTVPGGVTPGTDFIQVRVTGADAYDLEGVAIG